MTFLLHAAAAAVLTSTTMTPWSDSLQAQWVPADARWLCHIDVERILDAQLFKEALQIAGQEDLDEAMAEVERELGFNPLTELESVTIYSCGPNPENAVAMIEVSGPDRFVAAMAKGDGHTTDERDGYTVHRWGSGRGHWGGSEDWCATMVEIADTDRGLLVAAESTGELEDAMAVLLGRRANMAESDQRVLDLRPSGDAWVTAAARGLGDLADIPGASQFTKGAKDLMLEIGERQGRIYVNLDVETDSASTATSLVQVAQGGLALMRMAAAADSSDPDLRKALALTEGLRIRNDGAHLSLRIDFDAQDLIDEIHAQHGRGRAHRHDDHDDDHGAKSDDGDSRDGGRRVKLKKRTRDLN